MELHGTMRYLWPSGACGCVPRISRIARIFILRICEPFGVESRDSADDVETTSKDLADMATACAIAAIRLIWPFGHGIAHTDRDGL